MFFAPAKRLAHLDAPACRWHFWDMREPEPSPHMRSIVLGAVLLYLAACWGQRCAPTAERVEAPGLEESPPEAWATDMEDAGVIARPMPSKAFEGQKKPPCTPPRQVEIAGGCWVELASKPLEDHCGGEGFEHAGRCYVPVQQPKRPPVGIEP